MILESQYLQYNQWYSSCIFIVGDGYDLWDRTEVWGQIKIAKPIWDITPELVGPVGEIGLF